MKKIRIAILRCRPELRCFFETMQMFETIEVAGCWDKDFALAEILGAEFGVKPMTLEEIMSDPTIEIILNASDPKDSAEMTRIALMHGKNVYVNKMIALDFPEGQELYNLAKEKGVRLSCGPDTFFGAPMQTARYLLDHGMIGEVTSFVASVSRNSHCFSDVMSYLLGRGGHILYNMGGYFLSALCNFIGPVKRVHAYGRLTESQHKIKKVSASNYGEVIDRAGYDVLAATIEFVNGAIGTLQLNANSMLVEQITFDLIGEKGVISMGLPNNYTTPVKLQKTGIPSFEFPFTHGFQESHLGIAVAEMAWAMKNNRSHRYSAEQALHLLEIAWGIEQSIETGESYVMTTTMERMEPLPEGCIGNGFWAPGEESALAN